MTVAIVAARWVLRGAADRLHAALLDDGAVAHEDGRVLAVDTQAALRAGWRCR